MFTNCQGSKGKSAPLGVCLRQTTQVKHGEVAFATATRPSIDQMLSEPNSLDVAEQLISWRAGIVSAVGKRNWGRVFGNIYVVDNEEFVPVTGQ